MRQVILVVCIKERLEGNVLLPCPDLRHCLISCFLLAIPTIAGAQLLLTLDLVSAPNSSELLQAACGALIAGISAYLGIHFFIRLVNVTGMLPYVVYRVALGLTLLGVMVFY